MATTVSVSAFGTSTSVPASDSVTVQSTAEENFAARHVAAFFEKFERDHYECQELLSHTDKHWLLSTDDNRAGVVVNARSGHTGPSAEPPPGLIAQMSSLNDSRLIMLVPVEDYNGNLDMREVHQIVRELSFGIYALNQLPGISLEPNEDSTSLCQMPPAYIDTRIGRLLTDVDAALKALWHGVWFPREKRIKFAERWHNAVDINDGDMPTGDKEARTQLLAEFLNAGMIDASTDPDYCKAFDDLTREVQGGASSPDVEAIVEAERRYFMSRVDDIVLRIIFHQNSVSQYRNLFVVDSAWTVTSAVRDVDPDTTLSYERLDARLQLHRAALKEHLADKAIVRHQLNVLRLASFLTTLLIAMRRRMKVPDIGRMLPNMTSDETRTEREVPPLVIGENFKCTNFHYPPGAYFHMHGGILIDHETPDPAEPSRSIIDSYDSINEEASRFIGRYIDNSAPYQESYPAPVIEIAGSKYFVVALDFETYYPQLPQHPRWVLTMSEEIGKLRSKRPPINEVQIHEQFKKYFGYKRAIKLRNLPHGLRMTSQRGLVAMFSTLSRKCPTSRLGKHDENGMTLMHHAAVHNRPQIITALVHLGQDVNVRKISTVFGAGPTPLHLAVRCGSLDAVACLLAHGANVLLTDEQGWAAVHHAAYYDQERILRMVIRRNEAMVELQAKNELKSTPLLLAASSGALSTLKCLIDLGAYVLRSDEFGNDSIHLATMRYHANVLEFFIRWNHADVDVWNTLVGMLRHNDLKRKDAAVRCLELLTTTGPQYWRPLLDAGGVPALLDMLRATSDDSRQLHALVTAVLCNVSEHDEVREALTSTGASQVLVQFLECDAALVHSVDVSSRAAVVIADLADAGDHNRVLIAECGGVAALVRLLDSNLEDILANAVNAIRVLCAGDEAEIRTSFRLAGAIPHLVEFLSVSSDILQAGSAAAIATLAYHHRENQDAVIAEGAVKPLVSLIKGHIINSQIKSALAVEVLAFCNEQSQTAFLRQDASKALIRLLKMFSLEVKEQAALALWSLAGQTKGQQRHIAETIGIPMLIEILLRDSDKLQYVGCKCMMALGREDTEGQLRVSDQGGIQPLVRLLRVHKTSSRVILTVIQALASLCIGVAFCANKVLQTRIADENAISILVNLLVGNTSDELKVDVAYTLGCIVLCHAENLEQLQSMEAFSFDLVRNLLNSSIEEVRLKAGFALAIFAFNNMPQQYAIRQAGGLGLSCFEPFLLSANEIERATAAFQIVVLARVIVDGDPVELTAHGIRTLVNTLMSSDDHAIIHAAGLLSSLAHTRAGLPDAMLAVGVMPLLIDRLCSNCSESVRHSCAVTLGYLTYNRTAARQLLAACRNSPGLYDRLVSNVGTSSRLSQNFVAEFERARSIGLPCLSLEINGGPPVPVPKYSKACLQSGRISFANHHGNSTLTTSGDPPRAFSAPAFTSSQPPPPRIRKAGTVHFGEPGELPKHRSPVRTALPELVSGEQPSKPPSLGTGMSSSVSKSTSLQPGSAKSRSSSAVSSFKTHVSSWQSK